MFTFKRAKLQHFFQIYKFLAQNLQIISIILSFYQKNAMGCLRVDSEISPRLSRWRNRTLKKKQ